MLQWKTNSMQYYDEMNNQVVEIDVHFGESEDLVFIPAELISSERSDYSNIIGTALPKAALPPDTTSEAFSKEVFERSRKMMFTIAAAGGVGKVSHLLTTSDQF